jgi:hypothetical protein
MRDDMNNRRVQVYWNRTRHKWSVRDKRTRKLIGHAGDCLLLHCKMHVSPAGLRRCRKTGRHDVFAWIEGDLKQFDEWRERPLAGWYGVIASLFTDRLVFRPQVMEQFETAKTSVEVWAASRCQFVTLPAGLRKAGEVWFQPVDGG